MNTPCSFNQWLVVAYTVGIVAFGGGEFEAMAQSLHPMSAAARQNALQQIQALAADKASWTKAQQKLDTQLIFAARLKATGKVHPAAAKLRPSVAAEVDGLIKVEVKGAITPELTAAVKAAGGKIASSLPAYHILQAFLPVENLESIAARADVDFIRPAQKGHNNFVDSEGDYTHQAFQARANFPANGSGITVGVLSDSIDNGSNALAAAVASGNIDPAHTFWLPGQAGAGEGEGLAMCEVVHDLAPGATIYFATGAGGAAHMASNIVALAHAGCRIIVDDEFYSDESPFQDMVIAQAVKTVSDMGVLYFSCARNSGNLTSLQSSTWQGDFVSNYALAPYGKYLEFGSGVIENDILSGGYDYEADLFWSDPLGASTNDYDLYMLDSFGDIVYSSQNTQNGTQDPYEHIADPAQYSAGYYLVVTLYSGTNRFLHLDFGRGVLDWATAGCIRGHNACDAVNSFTVAATPADTAYAAGDPTGPYPSAFYSGNVVEYFSADGPRRMFYNPDGSPITPGNFSSTGGRVLLKPDFTAADGVTTTPPGFAPFFGTSCAAPHAAAIAALVLSYNPSLTPAQVRTVLTNSCIDIMGTGWDRNSGAGILMAYAALQNTPPPTLSRPPLKIARSGGNVIVTWPASAAGFTLQSSTSLASSPTAWSTVSPAPSVINGYNTVTNQLSGARKFYRLSQ